MTGNTVVGVPSTVVMMRWADVRNATQKHCYQSTDGHGVEGLDEEQKMHRQGRKNYMSRRRERHRQAKEERTEETFSLTYVLYNPEKLDRII